MTSKKKVLFITTLPLGKALVFNNMKGNVYLRDGSDGDSISMKSQLPRLRELLGPVSESDGLAPPG